MTARTVNIACCQGLQGYLTLDAFPESALQRRHADFWQVTADALDFTLETLGVEAPGIRERLLDAYLTLDAFPEDASATRSGSEIQFEESASDELVVLGL